MGAHVYNLCACIYARIFKKFETKGHKIVIDHNIKFHEDPSFRCRDICKTILVLFNHWFLMYFSYFSNCAPPKPSKMDNYWIIMFFLETRMEWNLNWDYFVCFFSTPAALLCNSSQIFSYKNGDTSPNIQEQAQNLCIDASVEQR